MKRKFILSSVILLFGGLVTKVLGMFIKIIMTRNLGVDGTALYMLLLPTFSLFISLGQIGLPIALSRLVALGNKNNKNLYFSIIPILLLINILFSLFIIFSSSFISNNLLHNNSIRLGIIAIAFVIPFTSLSSICRSYFFGKEKMFPHTLSLIIENIIRLIFMWFILPIINFLDIKYIVSILVLSNIVSELSSTIVLIFFLPKNASISISDLRPRKDYIYESFKLGLPNVVSNLISSLSYFLEPVILSNILLKLNFSSTYIVREYGIITGYIIPLLFLPSFFTLALSQAIMPYITREYLNKGYDNIKRRLLSVSIFILIISVIIILIFEFYGKLLLLFLYKSYVGYKYLKILAPVFVLQYLQSIFSFTLNGMGMVHDIFIYSIISSFVRIFVIIILCLLGFGIYSYIFSIIINIIISTLYLINRVITYLN